MAYSGIDDNLDSNKVLLIEADILKDDSLVKWLEKRKVDAVIGWLIGGNKSIAKRKYYIQLGIRDEADYRMKIEDSIYCLTNKILVSGKAINYVSRSTYPTDYDLNQHLEGVKEELDIEQGYEVSIYGVKEYNHLINGGIHMHATNPELITTDRRALISDILIKK